MKTARPKKGVAETRQVFLAAIASGDTVAGAAKKAKAGLRTVYNWRESNKVFREAWEDANEMGIATLEQEAIRRARDGVLKPVYQGGKKVGTVREHSDTLLIFMLKAKRPDVYRDRISAELTGKGGGPIQSETTTAERPRMTPKEWLEAHGVDLKEIADGVGSATRPADQRTAG